jgi:hypothetical protein
MPRDFFYNIDLDIILEILHQDMSKNDFRPRLAGLHFTSEAIFLL